MCAYKRRSPQPVVEGGTSLTTITAHDLIVGNGTGTPVLVAPSATSGVPLVSQGAAADPAYSTAVVSGGGTGVTSFTAYAVVCGGTTSTNPLQSIAGVGSSGQVLTSNGAAALPTFQAAPAPSNSGTPVSQHLTTSSSKTSTSTAIALTTTPTTANTVLLYSLTFAPANSANILIFEANISMQNTTTANAGLFLFAGTSLLCSKGIACGQLDNGTLVFQAAAGTTSSTTYSIYYASIGSGTTFINQDGSTNAFGNTINSTFIITEVKP